MLEKLMRTTPGQLAELQFQELRNHAVTKLKEVVSLIENNEFDKIKSLLVYSPAGDGRGTDTYHINFAYEQGDALDLMDIINKLKRLCIHQDILEDILNELSKKSDGTL